MLNFDSKCQEFNILYPNPLLPQGYGMVTQEGTAHFFGPMPKMLSFHVEIGQMAYNKYGSIIAHS